MATVRDTLCQLGPVQIPRPAVQGMQYIPTRGRQGFYKSIRKNGEKYGLAMKPQGPRRPVLSDDIFRRPETVKEEDSDEAVSPPPKPAIRHRNAHSDTDRSSTSSQFSSDSSQRNSPIELEPDYPSDYVPPQLPPPRHLPPRLPPASRSIKF